MSLRIACLGWGSLIWDARSLPIQRQWFTDGPRVPVEFKRQSSDGRITLVIDSRAAPVRVLWAMMIAEKLTSAKKSLADREGVPSNDWEAKIGSYQGGEEAPHDIPELPQWAQAHGIDAVIWTALVPMFGEQRKSPSAEQIVAYLKELRGPERDNAERYIRCAPRQIDTQFRRHIEAELGWTYRECNLDAV